MTRSCGLQAQSATDSRTSTMTSRTVIVLWFATVLATTTASVKFIDCGTTMEITDLRITDCMQQPCTFYQGREYKMEFDALPKWSTKTLPYTVKAKILFPWTLLRGDACEDLSAGACPILVSGQSFTFHKVFSVDIPFPTPDTVPTTIIAEMNDDIGQTLLCAKLPIEIKSAKLDPNPIPPTIGSKSSALSKFFSFFG